MTQRQSSDAARLEDLWAGEFGRHYADRNAEAGAGRRAFWEELLERHSAPRILEIGCNTGANLEWIAGLTDPKDVFGLDVSTDALETLRRRVPGVNGVWGLARELPFRDGWFDLAFTMGVLIHQPDESLPAVMSEIVRVSRRYILAGEYFAETAIEVPYRDQPGALFKRDYGRIYREAFPDITLIGQGFLGRDDGWDDVTWWLFEK